MLSPGDAFYLKWLHRYRRCIAGKTAAAAAAASALRPRDGSSCGRPRIDSEASDVASSSAFTTPTQRARSCNSGASSVGFGSACCSGGRSRGDSRCIADHDSDWEDHDRDCCDHDAAGASTAMAQPTSPYRTSTPAPAACASSGFAGCPSPSPFPTSPRLFSSATATPFRDSESASPACGASCSASASGSESEIVVGACYVAAAEDEPEQPVRPSRFNPHGFDDIDYSVLGAVLTDSLVGCKLSAGLIHLLVHTLDPDCSTRMTMAELLAHPWLNNDVEL